MILHAKYECSDPYGLGQEDFQRFFFWLPWKPEFFMGFKILEYSESTSPKDHFCEVSLEYAGFRGTDFLNRAKYPNFDRLRVNFYHMRYGL